MPEGPPIIKRCVGCPNFDRDNGELDYPPETIEDCDGPLEVVKGLVEVRDLRAGRTLRVGDASIDSTSRGCERDLELDPQNSLTLSVRGVRTVFMLNRKNAAVVNGMNAKEQQNLGDDIMEDLHTRIAGQLMFKDGDTPPVSGRPLINILSTPGLKFSLEQIHTELDQLSKGKLIYETALRCGNNIDLIEKGLKRALGELDIYKDISVFLEEARKSNGNILVHDEECRDRMHDYLEMNESDFNDRVFPVGYEELQKRVNDIEIPKKLLRSAGIGGTRTFLTTIVDGIKNAPFNYLSNIASERRKFLDELLAEVQTRQYVNEITSESYMCTEAAKQSRLAMSMVRGNLLKLIQEL